MSPSGNIREVFRHKTWIFYADGTAKLVSSSFTDTLWRWDPKTGQVVYTYKGAFYRPWTAWSDDSINVSFLAELNKVMLGC